MSELAYETRICSYDNGETIILVRHTESGMVLEDTCLESEAVELAQSLKHELWLRVEQHSETIH